MPIRRAIVLSVLLLFARTTLAQTTASLTGVVRASEPLAGARVVVTSPALQGPRIVTTGPTGVYHFPALPPGRYTIRVTADGFAPATHHATLELAQTTRADVTLTSGMQDSITVYPATQPEIYEPQIATTLTLPEIDRLPVQRNQLATAQLVPGVNANTLSNGVLSISGGPGYDNLVLVNGVVVNENTRGQMRPMYVEDAIQETTVLTGAVSAEYGRFTGGVVNTITKSGGDMWSGSLRDSLSNPSWSAQSPAREEREDNLNHVFEATLGGSLARERLWLFTSGRWAKNDTARQTVAIPAGPGTPASAPISYTESNDQKRYEAKLTGRVGESHSVVASYFGIDTTTENSRFTNNIYDLASLTERDDPDSLAVLRYDGVLGPEVLVEAQLARRTMGLSSGAVTTDIIGGTVVMDRANSNSRFHSPSLCAICDDEQRDNTDILLKAHAFADRGLGTHDLVLGVDRFEEQHLLDEHQSGSDFALFVSRAQFKDGAIYPVITPTNQNGGGTFIRWMPVSVAAQDSHLRTESIFVNDTWNATPHWMISAGARYDRNHAEDADGSVVADDSRISPRLAVQYDLAGDGRSRITASYAEYASRIADAIATSNQLAGSSAAIDFAYRGPSINANNLTVPLADALRMVFDYFNNTQGGTANRTNQNLRPNGSRDVPGYSTYFDGTLSTPYVRELTLGYGMEIGRRGFARIDVVSRDWRDFYALNVDRNTQRVTTPFGIPVDLALVRNTNDLERSYRGVHLQSRYGFGRFDAGLHYTWSKLRGNDDGETATGPSANIVPSLYYPEYFDYAQNNPIGFLRGDQRHRLRAWLGYARGGFSASLLQSFDSGLAWSVSAPISVAQYAANPGYASIPNGRYFFGERGALRTDDVTSTSLALRWQQPVLGIQLFVQGDVLNVFNENAIADPNRLGSGVSTAANSTTLQPFDPRTTTPVEGVHYQLAANFGQPLNNLAYQTPRTMRASVGLRF
jgi:outer membrane receptor for ferrienterochelin and colicin